MHKLLCDRTHCKIMGCGWNPKPFDGDVWGGVAHWFEPQTCPWVYKRGGVAHWLEPQTPQWGTCVGCICVWANIHFGSQTEFCPNGERKLFVMLPHQGEKNNELLQSIFVDCHRVVPDERLLCYSTSQVEGYLFRSVTKLVKQMCCLLPE